MDVFNFFVSFESWVWLVIIFGCDFGFWVWIIGCKLENFFIFIEGGIEIMEFCFFWDICDVKFFGSFVLMLLLVFFWSWILWSLFILVCVLVVCVKILVFLLFVFVVVLLVWIVFGRLFGEIFVISVVLLLLFLEGCIELVIDWKFLVSDCSFLEEVLFFLGDIVVFV